MNICHVINAVSQKTGGGAAKQCWQLAAVQAKRGHDVTIMAGDVEVAPQGVKLVPVATRMVNPSTMRRFDVLQLHNYRTSINLVAANCGIPFVVSAYGGVIRPRKLVSRFLILPFRNVILRGAARLIAVAPMEAEQYCGEGVQENRVTVIPVGIDMGEFARLPSRHHNGTVLFLGRIHPMKGLDVLVREAWPRIRGPYQLVVAGPDEQYQSQVVRWADDSIVFPGPLYGEDKLLAYRNATVYVSPASYEMWGLTFLEALACGTPVIMTDRCQMAQVLPDYCGLVVSYGNPAALADAITRAMNGGIPGSEEQRQAWVAQYDWSLIAPRIEKVYEEAVCNP